MPRFKALLWTLRQSCYLQVSSCTFCHILLLCRDEEKNYAGPLSKVQTKEMCKTENGNKSCFSFNQCKMLYTSDSDQSCNDCISLMKFISQALSSENPAVLTSELLENHMELFSICKSHLQLIYSSSKSSGNSFGFYNAIPVGFLHMTALIWTLIWLPDFK